MSEHSKRHSEPLGSRSSGQGQSRDRSLRRLRNLGESFFAAPPQNHRPLKVHTRSANSQNAEIKTCEGRASLQD